MPPDYAEMLGILFGLIAGGQNAHLSDGFQRALGREPVAFEAWTAREAGPHSRRSPTSTAATVVGP